MFMTRAPRLAIVLGICFAAMRSEAHAQPEPERPALLPRLAIEDGLEPAAVLDSRPPYPVRVAVRLSGRVGDRALEDRLADYVNRKVPVWLSVSPPASVDVVERWRAALQDLLSRHRDGIEIVEIDGAPDARLAAFAIRVAATEARSARDAIRVAVAVPRVRSASWLADVYTPELSPYVDVLTLSERTDEPAASAHLVKVDPDARLALLAGDAGDSADAAFDRIVNSQLDTVGTNVAMRRLALF